MKEGQKFGLRVNFHADELTAINGAEMGARLGALGMSHLEKISPAGIELMAAHKSVAVLLPTTAWIMHLEPPPARAMIEAGVPVAVASDFNPNAYCMSMPFVMNLGCILLGLSMNEALVAGTINAAASIGKSEMYGSLEVGKMGDLLVLDAPQWEHLFYRIADEPIKHVIKRGEVIEFWSVCWKCEKEEEEEEGCVESLFEMGSNGLGFMRVGIAFLKEVAYRC